MYPIMVAKQTPKNRPSKISISVYPVCNNKLPSASDLSIRVHTSIGDGRINFGKSLTRTITSQAKRPKMMEISPSQRENDGFIIFALAAVLGGGDAARAIENKMRLATFKFRGAKPSRGGVRCGITSE